VSERENRVDDNEDDDNVENDDNEDSNNNNDADPLGSLPKDASRDTVSLHHLQRDNIIAGVSSLTANNTTTTTTNGNDDS